jgi:chromosome segregation ATPase
VFEKMATAVELQGLARVTTLPYPEQAKYFLNAFWQEYGAGEEREACWKFVAGFQKLDNVKGKEGNELDEFWSHKFLETHGDTMTAIQMRNALKEIDMDCNKRMSFIEYALWKYKQTVKEMLSRPQGDNKEEIDKAQQMLKEVQRLFEESERKAEEARKALKEAESRESEARTKEADAKSKEAESKAKEADAKAREADAAAAKAELEAALADLNAQQQEYDNTTAELKAKTETGGQVAQNKAKNELAQHLNKPTLGLQRARITQEAAVKKAEKARLAAADARVAATEARQAAEKARAAAEDATRQAVAARQRSEQAKQAADAAVEEARAKVDEAEAFLQYVKSKPGAGQGSIWWMERELHEARAYLPERKGGYKKDT